MRIEKGRLRLPPYTEHLAALEGWVVVGIEIVDTHQLLAPAGAGSWAAQLLAPSGAASSAGPWKSSRDWIWGVVAPVRGPQRLLSWRRVTLVSPSASPNPKICR